MAVGGRGGRPCYELIKNASSRVIYTTWWSDTYGLGRVCWI